MELHPNQFASRLDDFEHYDEETKRKTEKYYEENSIIIIFNVLKYIDKFLGIYLLSF